MTCTPAGDSPDLTTARLPRAEGADDAEARAQARLRREAWGVVAAAVASVPLMLPMLGELLGQHWMLPAWLQFALATPVVLYRKKAMSPTRTSGTTMRTLRSAPPKVAFPIVVVPFTRLGKRSASASGRWCAR